MPQELPGLYYDAEKNRYFPIKGPIPGSSSTRKRKSSPPKPIPPTSESSSHSKPLSKITSNELLLAREICGRNNLISSRNRKLNFQCEYHKSQASQPMISKYNGTQGMVDRALEQVLLDVSTSDGAITSDFLLAGGLHGTLCLFDVGGVRQESGRWVNFTPDQVWPPSDVRPTELPRDLQRNLYATLGMPSDITCIKMLPNRPVSAADALSTHVMITTLGYEASRGSVYHLHFTEPIDYSRIPLAWRNIDKIASFNRTIWTADCSSDGTQAVIGTNQGAVMVNLETGVRSSVCRCESDVLSLEVDHSGNFILCGLRNGAILTLDARQKPEDYSARLASHHIPYPLLKPSSKRIGSSTRGWFELKGNLCPDNTIFMPSSVSCLASLKLYDQYFCASSMDGSIKLYDHRLIQRGAVQSYEGNVNSHTHLRFGVDPAERFLMSGGDDCNLRLWSMKSGELLFESKCMNSAPSIVCWPRTEGFGELQSKGRGYGESWQKHCYGAWVGSEDGLFYVNWS